MNREGWADTAETLTADVKAMLDTIAEWEKDDPQPEPPKKGLFALLLRSLGIED